MTAFRVSLVAAALTLPVALAPQPRVTALRFAAAVTGRGQTVRDAVIVVTGDRITRVGSGTNAVPSGAQVVDLRPYTAIPGLIDAHTHMTYYWDPASGTKPLQRPQPPRTGSRNRATRRRQRSSHPRHRCHDGPRSGRVGR